MQSVSWPEVSAPLAKIQETFCFKTNSTLPPVWWLLPPTGECGPCSPGTVEPVIKLQENIYDNFCLICEEASSIYVLCVPATYCNFCHAFKLKGLFQNLMATLFVYNTFLETLKPIHLLTLSQRRVYFAASCFLHPASFYRYYHLCKVTTKCYWRKTFSLFAAQCCGSRSLTGSFPLIFIS